MTGGPEDHGYVSLIRSMEEARAGEALVGDRQPMRWRIDWFDRMPILVLLDPMRLTAPDTSATGWALFDGEGRAIFLLALRTSMQAGDVLSLEPGGVIAGAAS